MQTFTFQLGETYKVGLMNGTVLDDAKVVAIDSLFVKFIYVYKSVQHIEIVSLNTISKMTPLRAGDSKKYYYWSEFEDKYYDSPRLGIGTVELSDEEYQLNKENKSLVFFEDEEEAKKYLFSKFGIFKSDYFVFDTDSCALYGTEDCPKGALAAEYKEYKKNH